MKKNDTTKITTCLYVIIGILLINTICVFVLLGKTDNKTSSNTDNTNTNENVYDVSMFASKKPAEITQMIKNGEQFVLYIGQSTCAYCKKMLPTLQKAQSTYGYKTVYLNAADTNVSSSDYKEMAKLLNVKKTSNGETKEFGEFAVTPMIAVLNGGKMIDGIIGYDSYENFATFLESAGIKK